MIARLVAASIPDRVMQAFLLQDLGGTQEAKEAWAAPAGERPDLPEPAVLSHERPA